MLSISASQCRAGRALLDWSQDQLAENAQVARATIADFERNIRMDLTRNNLLSLVKSMEAAGVDFIPEDDEGTAGVGVRFRKVEFEYSRMLRRADDRGVTMDVKFKGKTYHVQIPREVLDDIDRTNYHGNPTLMSKAVEKRLPIFLRAAEDAILNGRISDHDYVFLDHAKFDPGTF